MLFRSIAYKTYLTLATAALGALLIAPTPALLHAQQPAPFPNIGSFEAREASGWLGISIEEITASKVKELKLPGVYGALITQVTNDSPAAKAGIKNGDVITEYNGERVEGTLQLRRMVRETPPGRRAQITVWRDGHSQKFSVETVQAPSGPDFLSEMRRRFQAPRQNGPGTFNFRVPPRDWSFMDNSPRLGISAQDLTPQLGKFFGVTDGQGVLVSSVREGSAAEKAGLQAGDVITKIDGENVKNAADLREKLRARRDEQSVTLSVSRKGGEMAIKVEPQKPEAPGAGNAGRPL